MKGSIYDLVLKQKAKFMTNDPFEIADLNGIRVKFKDMALKGMYFINERVHYIVLSSRLDEHMTKVVLFHELGHHFLHKHLAIQPFKELSLYDMTTKPEMEANIYAANYVISDKQLMEYVKEGYTEEEVAKIMCIPPELVAIKVKDMVDRGYKLRISHIPKGNFLGG